MRRRQFLEFGGTSLAALLARTLPSQAAQARTAFRNLKVTGVDVFPLKTGSILVLVRTSEGITGLGECSPMNARVIVPMLKEALIPVVLGKNPLDIDRLWDEMFHRTST
jgi:L-alanine-DL-glutamate epimerase-like enolase superfamily enzyme